VEPDENDGLNRLLGDYAERKGRERQAADADEAVERRARANCADAVLREVLPVLEGIAARLRSAGHEASVSPHVANDARPHVVLSFAPVGIRGTRGVASASSLTFLCYGDRVRTREHLYGRHGHSLGPTRSDGGRSVGEALHAWAEAEAMRFVEAVLTAN
jgi:hypothetical protein